MPPIDMRKLGPSRVVTLANSNALFGVVLSIAQLSKHRQSAGASICGIDPESKMPLLETVDMLKYLRWLLERRHNKVARKELGQEAPPKGSLAEYTAKRSAALAQVLADKTKSST